MVSLAWGKMKSFWKQEEGLGTLEMLLIIAVILIIALIFKDKIVELINKLVTNMNTKSNKFMEDN